LKPQNVFLPSDWSTGKPGRASYAKLSDFSLGRRKDEPEDARLGLGTVGFMAPETIKDKRTSHGSDLFALGVLAFQILTGRHPFMEDESEPVKINSRVLEDAPPPLEMLRPDLPPPVVTMVNRLLGKSEDVRPDSAIEICQVLEETGATLPYRQMLQPRHLIDRDTSYEHIAERVLSLKGDERDILYELTDGRTDKARLLLTANFRLGKLRYENGRFAFTGRIYWPSRCRRKVLAEFQHYPVTRRKLCLKAAVAGSFDKLAEITADSTDNDERTSRSLPRLLLSLMRPATIKKLSHSLADKAERKELYELAAELHLQAGDLEAAERCADIAARQLNKRSENRAALKLLRKITRAATATDREFEFRQALELKGNVYKESGELEAAERTYTRVVELYNGRSKDKLLAETYNGLGDLYRLRQDSEASLRALQSALEILRKLNAELEVSHTYTNIGNVYWIEGDTRTALTNYRAAYAIQKRLGVKEDLASTLHNIATIFCLDGRLRRGVFLLNHALKLKRETGNQGEIARSLNNLGYAYQVLGEPARAVESLAESLDINRRIGSQKELLYNIENLVSLKISAGQLKDSLGLVKEGLEAASKHGYDVHLGSLHVFAAVIAKRMGKLGEAARSLDRAGKLAKEVDDSQMVLLHAIQSASLRYYLGDLPGALDKATSAYEKARDLRNTVYQLEALLLLNRLTNDHTLYEAALKAINDLHLTRERNILEFARLEQMITSGDERGIAEVSLEILSLPLSIEDDLESAWMNSVAAEICMQLGDDSQARLHLERGLRQAEVRGLVPETINARTLLGRQAEARGDYENCFAEYKRSLTLCKGIAQGIESEADRTAYQNSRTVQFLAKAIKRLSSRLGQRERAGR
jgi:tetratricopeptide (TPR) repeat protein